MKKEIKLNVKGNEIRVINHLNEDYISLTDMIKNYNDDSILYNWLRNRNTIEFLGIWERINNPNFNPIEFDRFKSEAGLNRFTLSPKKWIEATNAIGIISKAGRYGGGTFAQKDIAFEFGSWLSAEFKLYLIKEFQRLKEEEDRTKSLEWNLQRTLAKINYRIHTDSIKDNLVPPQVSKVQINCIYANEADILNVALFGVTAKEWRERNPDKEGNIRDYAALEQLIILVNLESMNAELVRLGLSQSERMKKLNEVAINQMKSLMKNILIKKLK